MDKFTAIQAFVRVVDAGSFSKAADLMYLPKPTVTRLVQMLERDLKVKLLHRTTRQLTMTCEGASYYEGALRLLGEMDELESSVSQATTKPRGQIKLELPTALAFTVVIPALPDFFARFPEIQIDVGVSNRSGDLVAEKLDCVVRIGPIVNESLIARTLAELPVQACATPIYLERHGAPRHPSELLEKHSLIRSVSPTTGRAFRHELRRHDEHVEVAGRHHISINDANGAIAACLSGLGIAITFRHLLQPYLDSGALVHVLPEWTAGSTNVQIAYTANRHLPNKVRVFIDWIDELFSRYFSKPTT